MPCNSFAQGDESTEWTFPGCTDFDPHDNIFKFSDPESRHCIYDNPEPGHENTNHLGIHGVTCAWEITDALMRQVNPCLPPAEIEEILVNTAQEQVWNGDNSSDVRASFT